jgi:hypothetical protein
MLIYEVNLSVNSEIAADYAQFLKHHIPEVVQVGGFTKADWFERRASDEGLSNTEGRTLWTIHYHVASREALDRYLREHAPKMRAEAVDRFGDRFQATRRILEKRADR